MLKYSKITVWKTLELLKFKALTSLLISRTLIRNFFRRGSVTFKMLFCHGGISASCIPHTFKAISSEFLFATSTWKLKVCKIINYIKDLSRNGWNTDCFTVGGINHICFKQCGCTSRGIKRLLNSLKVNFFDLVINGINIRIQ